jgi:hypothetical protein
MSKLPEKGLTGASPAELRWLTGAWLGRNGEDHVEEHWSPLHGNTLMGMFRWVKDGTVWCYELCVIEQEGPLVFMRVKHFFPKLIGWEEKDHAYEFVLVQLQDGEAVFLELDQPQARWLVYRLTGQDQLVYYFTWENKRDTDTGIFEFTRQS